MPIPVGPAAIWRLRGYRMDLAALDKVWAILHEPERPEGYQGIITVEDDGGNVTNTMDPAAAARPHVKKFSLQGRGLDVEINLAAGVAEIQTHNNSGTMATAHDVVTALESLEPPRWYRPTMRDPYRFEFVAMTPEERRVAARHHTMVAIAIWGLVLAALAILVTIAIAAT